MYGIRSKQPVELLRQGILGLDAAGSQCGLDPPRGILSREQPPYRPLRVCQRRFDGMDSIEEDVIGIGRPPWISGISPAGPKAVLRLVFRAWQGGETPVRRCDRMC
jgi:hypothetical protein